MKINKTLFIVLMIVLAGAVILSLSLLLRGGATHIDNTEMDMVLVEGGTFTMGTPGSDGEVAYPAESPAHPVTLSDFHIGKYEVTVGQFAEFVAETGYTTMAVTDSMAYGRTNNEMAGYFGAGSSIMVDGKDVWETEIDWRYDQAGTLRTEELNDYPVVHVCIADATAYCNWLAMKTGKPFRLPTEAEWEYAARGGQLSAGTTYSGSNNIDEVAWYRNNSDTVIHKIGTKKPNELGIYDMSGNVSEWCSDMYLPYTAMSQTNPKHIARELVTQNVIRGGSWYRYQSYCRVTDRFRLYSVNRGGGVGFRVAY